VTAFASSVQEQSTSNVSNKRNLANSAFYHSSMLSIETMAIQRSEDMLRIHSNLFSIGKTVHKAESPDKNSSFLTVTMELVFIYQLPLMVKYKHGIITVGRMSQKSNYIAIVSDIRYQRSQ